MIAQYQALKAEHPGCLLFFRLGDFYEMFFDDAERAAPALDIALTKRGRHGGDDIPMCGVPVHSAEGYLERLIRKGFKVAICEQTEAPAAARQRRGAKALVERDVVRVVTPGTLSEDSLLDARRHNFLAALARRGTDYALAWLEMSTGEFRTAPVVESALGAELARLDPGELLLPEGLLEVPELVPLWRELSDRSSPLADREFDSLSGERRLERTFRVAVLDGFGTFSRAELGACGALIGYLELTQKGQLPRLAPPRQVMPGSHLMIDAATRRNLELLGSLSGTRQGSLLAAVDRTVTGAGARLLAARLAAPLAEAEPIRRRLDAVQALVDEPALRADLRAALRGCPDLERALSRLSLDRGGPRDLAAVRRGLAAAVDIKSRLADSGTSLATSGGAIVGHGALIASLEATLVDEPPVLARDGGLIRPGHDDQLDQLRGLRDQARRNVAELEARLQGETAIGSLKIRHNNMLGYYVEVTATHLAKVPDHFVQRQSMANATRYSTRELAELESQIAGAAGRALALELELFVTLRHAVLAEAEPIARTARVLARLDVAAALGELAVEQRYQRPEVDDSDAFSIEAGRHPVVEQALEVEAKPFVPNHADLSAARRLWLLTGSKHGWQEHFLAAERADRHPCPKRQLRAGGVRPHRRHRSPVLAGRCRRRSGARPVDVHGRDGGDGGDPQSGHASEPGDPGRDRPRHRHLRRPFDRLGGGRASPRGQPLPRAVRHPLP